MGLTTNQRIRNLRKDKGLSQATVAKELGVSRPAYINIEKGRKELTLSQFKKLAAILRVEPNALQAGIIARVPDESVTPKFKQIILNSIQFGSDSDGKITKTKLAKLVYLMDFKWFYDHLKPLTGLEYIRMEQGPVPNTYFQVIDELFDEGSIAVETKGRAFMISTTEKPSHNLLSQSELKTIRQVAKKWQGKDTKQIVDFTHKQLPWAICRPKEVIPYELITQEDPSNVF